MGEMLKNVFMLIMYYSGVLGLMVYGMSKIRNNHHAGILFYHRFSEHPVDGCELPHLDIEEFRKQMRHVRKWYNVITMDELVDRLAKGGRFSSPSIVITIDDGYLNNYTEAYPVLKKLSIPAMIYLSTGFIGTEDSTWVDDLMDMIKVSKKKTIIVP